VRIAPSSARIYGAELSLRWQLPKDWSGWTSYSWSEATDHFGDARALRTWDQKHSVATGLSWARGRWQHSANVTWHSGWRRNALSTTEAGALFLEPRNGTAWPAYFSLDARSTWTKPLAHGELEVFAELDNLTNHANDCCVSYSVGSSAAALTSKISTWLPRLYLLGVTWRLP
jgi:outer membrane receptor protein involved in Fe transport